MRVCMRACVRVRVCVCVCVAPPFAQVHILGPVERPAACRHRHPQHVYVQSPPSPRPHSACNGVPLRARYLQPVLLTCDACLADQMRSIIANPEVIAIDQVITPSHGAPCHSEMKGSSATRLSGNGLKPHLRRAHTSMQDELAVAGDRRYNLTSGAQVWSRPLANGDTAVVLYNAHNKDTIDITATWAQVRTLRASRFSRRPGVAATQSSPTHLHIRSPLVLIAADAAAGGDTSDAKLHCARLVAAYGYGLGARELHGVQGTTARRGIH